MNCNRYRWCVVSSCTNSSNKTPEKLFVKVPDDIKMRNVWLGLAKRDPKSLSPKSRLYLCEDHFNLEQDMENYMEYKIMGSVKQVKMKRNTTPSRFCFHPEKKYRLMTRDNLESSEQKTYYLNLYPVKLEKEEDFKYSCKYDKNCVINVKDEQFEATETITDGKFIYNNDFTKMQICDASDIDEQIVSAHLIKPKFKKEDPHMSVLLNYKCTSCYKGFLDEESYNNHVMCHTNMTCDHMESSEQETHNLNLYPVKLEKEEDLKYGCEDNLNCLINVKDKQFEATETAINGTLIYNNDFTEIQICDASDLDEQIVSAHLNHEEQKSKFKQKGGRREGKDSPTNLLDSGTLNNQIAHAQNERTDISETQILKESKDLLTIKQIETNQITRSVKDINSLSPQCHKDTSVTTERTEMYTYRITNNGNLEPQVQSHTENETIFCKKNQDVAQSNVAKLPKVSHPKQKIFNCQTCHKNFTKKSKLKTPLRTHTGERPFNREVCLKSISITGSLNIHREIRREEKPFNCEVCLKSFSVSSSLRTHLRTHTGEKPFKCKLCLKSFAQISSLNRHLRTHTGEKPFNCKVCLKSFAQISSLHRHLRIHTGEKPFNCDECLMSFTQISSLHKHLRTHTGEKPFNCKVCPKSFSVRHVLKRHLRTHTGEKPFKREVCLK